MSGTKSVLDKQQRTHAGLQLVQLVCRIFAFLCLTVRTTLCHHVPAVHCLLVMRCLQIHPYDIHEGIGVFSRPQVQRGCRADTVPGG